MPTASHSDLLIIGAGIFGVSTAYHVALRQSLSADPPNSSAKKLHITLVDRSPHFPCPLAASTDINKIVRADYTSPFYMNLAYEAIEAWRSLPFFTAETNADVYHRTGWIMMDEKGSDVAVRVREALRQDGERFGRKDESATLTEEEARERCGALLEGADLSRYSSFYWNPSAGWANADHALRIMAEEAVKLGVEYVAGEVEEFLCELGVDGIKGVRLGSGEQLYADKILVATGAWTSALMTGLEDRLGLSEEDRVESQITAAGVCVAHFNLDAKDAEKYGQLPVLIYGSEGEVLPPTQNRVFKFTNAHSFTNTVITPSGHTISSPPRNTSQNSIPTKLEKECIASIRSRLPAILDDSRQVDSFRLCWDSISPDQNPLITQHPDPRLSNLYFAVGGSFHSWKFLPVIGKYVANVLSGQRNDKETEERWKWKRPNDERKRGVHEKVVPRRELRDLM